ncbi:hypothetical protein P6439_14240 [Staphylococcus arlettae]|nr:hypothetical protein [Staphylococcus arlettae]
MERNIWRGYAFRCIPTKSEAEAEIENNLATRDIDEDFIEESKADEYMILETQINEADITKIV